VNVFRVALGSSCLIGLVQIDKLGILEGIFAERYIPHAVYDEVVVRGKERTGADEIASAVRAGWLTKAKVRDMIAVNALTTNISQGEAEVIILAKEMGLDYALIDEKTARNVAALMNVKTTGLLGVLGMGFPLFQKAAAVIQIRVL